MRQEDLLNLEVQDQAAQHHKVSLCRHAGVQWRSLSSLQSPTPWFKQFSASASRVAGIRGTHHHTQLIFVFLVEPGFRHEKVVRGPSRALENLPLSPRKTLQASLVHCPQTMATVIGMTDPQHIKGMDPLSPFKGSSLGNRLPGSKSILTEATHRLAKELPTVLCSP
ncbi:hypothetical protein AAY473_030871, partial [Plecturocebus cupreus]